MTHKKDESEFKLSNDEFDDTGLLSARDPPNNLPMQVEDGDQKNDNPY